MTTPLITGGTGKAGRRVAAQLTALNHTITIGSRAGPHPFGWDDESTRKQALEACDSTYLAYAPDLAFPGAAELVGRFAATAVAAGTSRLVPLSGRGEQGTHRAEPLVIGSGTSWTVVRCAFFAQNFSESTWVEAIRVGRLELPGDTAEPILNADDIAEVVATVLIEAGHTGQVNELTGPRLLTFAEAVQGIGAATGHTITFEVVTGSQLAVGLHDAGMPLAAALSLAELFTEVLDGHHAHQGDGVRRALGRDPRDFGDYVRRTAQTGVWGG